MATTIIAPGITIEGELTSDDEIEVAGTVRGRVLSKDAVTVAAGAVVEAEVTATSVHVGGQLTGNVSATDRVEIQPGARLVGDVKAARLTIADGASFKGNVDMDV
jgi:cytoskeletal protein CcmA (bactofilin family)